MRRSQFGRDNTQGKALSDDFRESVVTSLISSGVYSQRRTIKVPINKIEIISNNRIYKMFHIRSHRTML